MTDKDYSNRFAYHFLFLTRDNLIQEFGSDLSSAIAFSINEKYLNTLKASMVKYSVPEHLDNFAVINQNIRDVQEIMMQNIEKIIARGEKIEILVAKSEELEVNAKVFKKKANSAKKHFCIEHFKIILLVIVIVIAIIVISVILMCGTDLHKCKHQKPSPTVS
jgi:vesicle-associated membrane protein 7